MKAYKVFNPDWTCIGFQYKVGEVYEHDGNIRLCWSGFHACTKLIDCFSYYRFDPANKVATVEILGQHFESLSNSKIVTDKIKIINEGLEKASPREAEYRQKKIMRNEEDYEGFLQELCDQKQRIVLDEKSQLKEPKDLFNIQKEEYVSYLKDKRMIDKC